VTTSVAIEPRRAQRLVTWWGASPCHMMNQPMKDEEWHLVTWYGVMQCVDLRPRKISLESVFLGPLPEQKQDSHWSLDQGNYSLMACFITDGLLRVTLFFMKETLNSYYNLCLYLLFHYVFEINSAVLKVTLIKPWVNTDLSTVKLSVKSNDKGRVWFSSLQIRARLEHVPIIK